MLLENKPRGFIVVDSPRGSDATAERDSWDKPYATLSHACKFIRNYDTVLIYPGPYVETPMEPVDTWQLPRTGAPIWLWNLRGVTLRGVGQPVIWFTSHGNGLLVEGCSDITIEGLHFRGAGILREPKPYYFALLILHGSNERVHVRDCTFSESGNHGIGHLIGPRDTNNSTFENNHFVDGGHLRHPFLGADGAAIAVGGSDNRICGNSITNWLRGVELEASDPRNPTSRIVVSGNRIYQCSWQNIVVIPTHEQAHLFDQITISDNIVAGTGTNSPVGYSQTGISIWGGRNMRVVGNSVRDMYDGIGIHVQTDKGPVSNVVISENTVQDVARTGIHVARVRFPNNPVQPLTSCQVHHNAVGPVGGRGIWIDGDYNTVDFNHVRDCGNQIRYEGLYLAAGAHNSFRFNSLYNSSMKFLGESTVEVGNTVHTVPTEPPGFTGVTRQDENLILSWPEGALESALDPAGPWTPAPGLTSPATVPMTRRQRFFRLRRNSP